MIVNHSSNVGQTNAYIFRLLGSTDMKQSFSNSSGIGEHDDTKAFTVTTFLYRETSAQKIYRFFFIFVNILPIAFITLLHTTVKLGLC